LLVCNAVVKEDGDLGGFPDLGALPASSANSRPLPSPAPIERSGAPKITTSLLPIRAIAALEAMPSLEGLQVKLDVSAGPLVGYCHFNVPSLALMA
jgi:hypothetical protein